MIILNTNIQYAQSEHESEERAIVRYKETEESPIESKIINKSSLDESELLIWENFKTIISDKI
jgi:hypothetical protein